MAEQDAASPSPEPANVDPAPAVAAEPAAVASAEPAAAAAAPVTEAAAPAPSEPVAAPAAEAAAPAAADPVASGSTADFDQAAIDDILKQASFEGVAEAMGTATPGGAAAANTEELKLPDFNQVMQEAQVSSIDLLRDVDLNVKIELGRSRMLVEDVLKLGEGSVVELDKLAGDPVDVFVNERLIARGEVLVLNDNFCVRINEILAGVKEEGL
jgi:flagellar motor switch protein FliN/FliY